MQLNLGRQLDPDTRGRPTLAYCSSLWIAAAKCFRLSSLVTACNVAKIMTYEIHDTRYGETQFAFKQNCLAFNDSGYFLLSFLPCLLTYSLTPRSRVLLDKLTGSQVVKKFPAFNVTRRFIIAFTTARHLSLS